MSRVTPANSPPVTTGRQADNVARTKILLMGLRRSGKTSIQQVLFNNLAPRETLYLETTTQITRHYFDTIIPLEIWDCPGDVTLETLDAHLTQFSTMIFVIDIQDTLNNAIQRLVDFVVMAYQEHPTLNLEVFVHKADVLSEEYKIDNFRQIQARILSDLSYIGPEYESVPINFQLTSIHDHSLHDAFSRVLHKVIDSLPYLEDLMNIYCANSQALKAFLFDVVSKLYVATDASPVDSPTHNLCSDYLQTLKTFGPLYKSASASPPRTRTIPRDPFDSPPPSEPASPQPQHPPASRSNSNSCIASPLVSPALSAHQFPQALQDPLPSPSSGSSRPSQSASASTARSAFNGTANGHHSPRRPHPNAGKPFFYPSAAASLTPTATGTNTTLTYHLINPQLALLTLIPTAIFSARRGLIEYNVVQFREGVQEICEVEAEMRRVEP